MEEKVYILTKIEGEYAYLTPEEGVGELFIAMALLPVGADIGARLSYSNLEFKILL